MGKVEKMRRFSCWLNGVVVDAKDEKEARDKAIIKFEEILKELKAEDYTEMQSMELDEWDEAEIVE